MIAVRYVDNPEVPMPRVMGHHIHITVCPIVFVGPPIPRRLPPQSAQKRVTVQIIISVLERLVSLGNVWLAHHSIVMIIMDVQRIGVHRESTAVRMIPVRRASNVLMIDVLPNVRIRKIVRMAIVVRKTSV